MVAVLEANSPVFASADNTSINLNVRFDTLPGFVPFTARTNDSEAHGRYLFERALAGDYGTVQPYQRPQTQVIDKAQLWEQLAVDSRITQDEALAAVRSGTLPAMIEANINLRPAGQRFGIRMFLARAPKLAKNNALVRFALANLSDAEVDQLWNNASER